MNGLRSFLQLVAKNRNIATLKETVRTTPEYSFIYPESIHEYAGSVLFMVRYEEKGKKLIITRSDHPIYLELNGEVFNTEDLQAKECDLSIGNSKIIRKYFSFTNPVSLAHFPTTIGLGDRLGVASSGHIKVVKKYNVRPVLAQQSMRELNLTGRTYEDVLSDVVWAVFQEDYQGGYGADGDHLKTVAEIKLALDAGYSMITLDCSEHITNLPSDIVREEIDRLYTELPAEKREDLENRFLQQNFVLGSDLTFSFPPDSFRKYVVIYQKAIDFAIKVYREVISNAGRKIDFEISIDETATPTDPLAHFFFAKQLLDAGVEFHSMAPRFCGEFQKGIDYIGDIRAFEQEFRQHQQIAEYLGYKLSIHSGSDKFSVFPIIGKNSGGRFHLKTAGTNWLEAVKVIITMDPELYRQMHAYALQYLAEARKYYHVTLDVDKIPDLSSLADEDLKQLMEENDSRQLIHITYGLILQAKNDRGEFLFKDRIYHCLDKNESVYEEFLQKHIGKHLETLGVSLNNL